MLSCHIFGIRCSDIFPYPGIDSNIYTVKYSSLYIHYTILIGSFFCEKVLLGKVTGDHLVCKYMIIR